MSVSASPPAARRQKVLAVCSNKGGVGKTTVATNLAIYLRALHEDLPVLLLGLDDQDVIDRMFGLARPLRPGEAEGGETNLKHAWAERSLDRAMRLGQYGIHYVPTPPDTDALKARAQDPRILAEILAATEWSGLVILDTKSDLEELTRCALQAADLVVLPVADHASFAEAAKAFAWLERLGRGRERGRVLLTLVDRRTRIDEEGRDLHDRLRDAIDAAGYPRFATYLSRSPRVEAINSASGHPGSILHEAKGTAAHRQLRELAEEVGKVLDLTRLAPPALAPPTPITAAHQRSRVGDLKEAFLRGFRSR